MDGMQALLRDVTKGEIRAMYGGLGAMERVVKTEQGSRFFLLIERANYTWEQGKMRVQGSAYFAHRKGEEKPVADALSELTNQIKARPYVLSFGADFALRYSTFDTISGDEYFKANPHFKIAGLYIDSFTFTFLS